MNFNNHSNLVGQHAFLGASKYHWLNYDATKIAEAYRAAQAVQMGTRLHAFAAECIDLRQRLPKSRKTLNMYVNDAIGYNLKPEQVLYTRRIALVPLTPSICAVIFCASMI